MAKRISLDWQDVLRMRLAQNITRTEGMKQEFKRLVEAFSDQGVRCVAIKGFTLARLMPWPVSVSMALRLSCLSAGAHAS